MKFASPIAHPASLAPVLYSCNYLNLSPLNKFVHLFAALTQYCHKGKMLTQAQLETVSLIRWRYDQGSMIEAKGEIIVAKVLFNCKWA